MNPHGAPSDQVLAQAFRAMAGGGHGSPAPSSPTPSGSTPRGGGLTATHVMLIAAIIGVVIGMGAGLVVLLT